MGDVKGGILGDTLALLFWKQAAWMSSDLSRLPALAPTVTHYPTPIIKYYNTGLPDIYDLMSRVL